MKKKLPPVVAIVEDDLDDQLFLKRAFDECRHDLRIQLFTSGESLLDYLEPAGTCGEQGSASHLVIIDLDLPGESLFELIEKLKATPRLKCIPVVVLTGSASDLEVKRCYDLGANTVITKPILFDELVRVLKTLCDYWFEPVRM